MHSLKTNQLYWQGNIAKCRVIEEILHQCQTGQSVTIFDYGCGDSGDWPLILQDNPHLNLIGYEPYGPSYKKAVKRLSGQNAVILSGKDIELTDLQAHYIISFSVFEHVVDREFFLSNAKRILAPTGVFYLNYDDGHFRNILDMSLLTTWFPALKAFVRTTVSPMLAFMGFQSHYQQRVTSLEVDELIKKIDFIIERVDYHNLICLKSLYKTIPAHLHHPYSELWLDFEKRLNDEFKISLPFEKYGDCINLWQQMVSRTLCIKHK